MDMILQVASKVMVEPFSLVIVIEYMHYHGPPSDKPRLDHCRLYDIPVSRGF